MINDGLHSYKLEVVHYFLLGQGLFSIVEFWDVPQTKL